jgi:D-amino peptidase
MKVFIMTDMEGVCGVLDHDNWVLPSGRYYDDGKKLLTLEVNAAVEGFCEAGATEVFVADGHGAGGINQLILDSRTHLFKNFLPEAFPFMLDSSFDAIAWVGQHAKAGTAYAHIAHTSWFNVLDVRINQVSVGEFGLMALCAASLGVTPIFGSGDEAFAKEAIALVEGIETTCVKKGLNPEKGDDADCNTYRNRNIAAVHMHPVKARELIRDGAFRALRRYMQARESFILPQMKPPLRKSISYRKDNDVGGFEEYAEHPSDIVKLINMKGIVRR